jgi:hypothetical protein
MPLKTKYLRQLFIQIAILINLLMQYSCSKETEYVSWEEFVSTLTGEWIVDEFTFGDLYAEGDSINISYDGDFLKYSSSAGAQVTYSENDTVICELNGIEFMQRWTISYLNEELILQTNDLCGLIGNYKMDCSNVHHMLSEGRFGLDRYLSNIEADLIMTKTDTANSILECKAVDFRIIPDYKPDRIYFGMIKDQYYYFFTLNRQ